MSETTNERIREIPLRSLYRVLFRHKRKSLGFFLVVFGGVFLATILRSESYRSSAKLLIRIGRESVSLDPTATTGATVDLRQSRDNELNSELAILRSSDLHRKAVEAIGAKRLLNPQAGSGAVGSDAPSAVQGLASLKQFLKGTVKELKSAARSALRVGEKRELSDEDSALLVLKAGLDIDLLESSNVIAVSFTSPDPELAREVVSVVVEQYLDKHIEVHKNPGSYRFFSQQAEKLAMDLERSEAELRDLKNAAGITSLEDHRRMLLERLALVEKDLGITRADLAAAQAMVRALEGLLDRLPEIVQTAETKAHSTMYTDALQQRLNELRLLEVELEQNFREDSRRIQGLRRQIATALDLLESQDPETTEVTMGANPTRQQIELSLLTETARVSALQGKVGILEEQERRARAELEAVNGYEVEVARRMRVIRSQEQNLVKYSENLEQARVDQALQLEKISNIAVLQPATLPLESDRPGKSLVLAIGLLLAFSGAIALAFVAEFLDQSVRTADDVEERLGVGAIASIPRRSDVRLTRTEPGAGRGELSSLHDRILTSSNGAHRAPPIVFGVTSARSGEGVSTVTAHLAATLARHGHGPVLLVDAALDKPSLHRIFDTPASPGLTECIDGSDPGRIRETVIPNLEFLSAGQTNGSASRLLSSERFEALVRSWKRSYRFVFIDLPPVGELTGAARLAGKCDAVLLVVEAENQRWQVIDHTLDRLRSSHANTLGVVLNKRRHHIPGWLYSRL